MSARLYKSVNDESQPVVNEIRRNEGGSQVKWTVCAGCGKLWWANLHGHGVRGFAARCGPCGSLHAQATRNANFAVVQAFRLLDMLCCEMTCSLCGRACNAEDFYRRTREPSVRCKDCERDYAVRNKEQISQQQSEYYLKHREQLLRRVTDRQNSFRKLVIETYGGKCECCKESTYDFLTIDHIDGYDKSSGIPRAGQKLVEWLIKNNYPTGYRILCFNCNAGRAGNRGVCPHNGEVEIEKLSGGRSCSRCHEKFASSMFTVNRRNGDGLESACRVCVREYGKSVKRNTVLRYSNGIGACLCCGENNVMFLNIDHVNNNGYTERKSGMIGSGSGAGAKLRKLGYPSGYQILCFNCNWSKFTSKGVCVHQKKISSATIK